MILTKPSAQRSPMALALLAFTIYFRAQGAPDYRSGSGASLTARDRVWCQTRIARVEHERRLWPAENPGAKPQFDTVAAREAAKERVRYTEALERVLGERWGVFIGADALQGEMDRFAVETRDSDALRDYFAALDNDPYLIAECLALPIKAESLARRRFESDEEIHAGELARIRELRGRLSDVRDWSVAGELYQRLRVNRASAADIEGESREEDRDARVLDDKDFEAVRRRYGTGDDVTEIRDEGEDFAFSRAVKVGEDRGEWDVIRVRKRSFSEWMTANLAGPAGPDAEARLPSRGTLGYRLPLLAVRSPTATCTYGWNQEIGFPIDARHLHVAVWTGVEMIVWGGLNGNLALSSGGRYNPATDSWRPTSMAAAPVGRDGVAAAWSGSELMIWGGYTSATGYLNSGARYNPVSDSWQTISVGANTPDARLGATVVWSGSVLVVWGGYNDSGPAVTGGRYNPATDSWLPTSTAGAVPSPRYNYSAVWTGSELIIWGGTTGSPHFNTGGRYNPATDTWTATSTGLNVPEERSHHTAVWTGTEMIVWGGIGNSSRLNTGGRYDPSTDSWLATSNGPNTPAARNQHAAVWAGSRMMIWGGTLDGSTPVNSGSRYDPSTDDWQLISTGVNVPDALSEFTAVGAGGEMIVWGGVAYQGGEKQSGARYNPVTDVWMTMDSGAPVPTLRSKHTAIMTGAEMVIWGGQMSSSYLGSGGRYNPATNSWRATSMGANTPSARIDHTAIWTGSEMIVWGGYGNSGAAGDGARYNPATDLWTPVSTGTNAPAGRRRHTAVWSGTQMIVWGGLAVAGYVNTGGRYTPGTDSWLTTAVTANTPVPRHLHSAVWAGSRMVVWGGYRPSSGYLNSGGRYNPSTDAWLSTSVGAGVPTARGWHTAVWTGTEVIVWGGDAGGASLFNTGGKYSPGTDSWAAVSTGANVPSVRTLHTATWTGTEMIVWGGINSAVLNSGGRYTPTSDTWVATPVNADTPRARSEHSAIWTGTQLLIWGGNPASASGRSFGTLGPSGMLNNSAADVDACASSAVQVTWSAPANWNDGSGTRTYQILRDGAALSAGGCGGTLNESTLSCLDNTASPGVLYRYAVRAVNACGAAAVTPGSVAGDVPDLIPPVMSAVRVDKQAGALQIDWTINAPPDAVNYLRYFSRNPTPPSWIGSGSGSATTWLNNQPDATDGSSSFYTVTAADSCGNESAK